MVGTGSRAQYGATATLGTSAPSARATRMWTVAYVWRQPEVERRMCERSAVLASIPTRWSRITPAAARPSKPEERQLKPPRGRGPGRKQRANTPPTCPVITARATKTDYEKKLGLPELSRFAGRSMPSITANELAKAYADIHARCAQYGPCLSSCGQSFLDVPRRRHPRLTRPV